MYGSWIVAPNSLYSEVLNALHSAHQGITSMKAHTQTCVYWHGMSTGITGTLHRVTASSYTQITSVLHGHLPTVQLSNFAWQYYHGSCPVPPHPCPQIPAPAPGHAGIRSRTISTIPIPSQWPVSTCWHRAVLPGPLLSSMPTTPMPSLSNLLELRPLSVLMLPKHLQFAHLHHVPPQDPTWSTTPTPSGLNILS